MLARLKMIGRWDFDLWKKNHNPNKFLIKSVNDRFLLEDIYVFNKLTLSLTKIFPSLYHFSSLFLSALATTETFHIYIFEHLTSCGLKSAYWKNLL